MNGNEVFRDFPVQSIFSQGARFLGLAGRFGAPGSKVRVTMIRVRALKPA